jgi:hypothetical protein
VAVLKLNYSAEKLCDAIDVMFDKCVCEVQIGKYPKITAHVVAKELLGQ